MNNPTLFDRLTGQIPGKTEGVSILTLVIGLIGAVIHMIWGINLSPETLTLINTLAMGGLGLALGARTSRVETTVNQVQAAQTTAIEKEVAK